MSDQDPTPQEAGAAVAEASRLKAAVVSSDRMLRPTLLTLAGASVAISIVVLVVATSGPPGWPWFVGYIAVSLAVVGGLAAFELVHNRVRAYSRRGNLLFRATIVSWILWAGIVSWWFPWVLDPSQRRWHYLLGAMVSVVPLLVGAWLIGRRR